MKKLTAVVLTFFLLTTLRILPAKAETTKPIVNTTQFTSSYHSYIDVKNNTQSINGSGFGTTTGKLINKTTNSEIKLGAFDGSGNSAWSPNVIYFTQTENAGVLIIGPNTFVVQTAEGVESDPFTITFEKYWIGPNILLITPAKIHLGDQVEILGENFGDSQPTDCPVIPSTPAVPVQVACGLLNGNNQPQKIVSWSNTKIVAIIDNSDTARYVGDLQPIRVVVHKLISNNDRTRTGMSGHIEILAPSCSADTWSCGSWSICSTYGLQTRNCIKTFDCPVIDTPSPATSQSCTPPQPQQITPITPPTYQQPTPPSCSEDIWQCGDWNSCSPNGIQTRSCKRTYDCPSAETPPPATSQYCQAPNQPQMPPYSVPSSGNSSAQPNNTINENTNQDAIVQSTVKLICLVNATSGMQGSGTMIDPKGIILTNRHVVEGTKGCVVGFINNAEDDPSYTEVADIVKLSTDEDIALIKIRNDGSKSFVYSDISSGSVNSKNLGNKVMIFGYPSIGGAKLNYSDGAVSGFGSSKDGLGNYLKTTAMIEHGNSGGGAYLMSNNYFIGIPSAGIKGELASIGYILSVNKIKSWLSGSGLSYNSNGFKNLSNKSIRTSIELENIDLENINLLDVSSANVSIYSNKNKTTLLPNNPGTIQTFNKPTFQINNIDEESDIVGYYVYFGTNMKADPVKKGKLIKKSEYTPNISAKGVYYFIFRAKDSNGIISEPVITEYRYKK